SASNEFNILSWHPPCAILATHVFLARPGLRSKAPRLSGSPGGSGSRSPCSFRRRGTHRIAETAILARCLPAVTGRTQRLPPGPVPEHRFIAAVRIDVVDDRCRTDHVMTTTLDA